jgi:hypothetical protein
MDVQLHDPIRARRIPLLGIRHGITGLRIEGDVEVFELIGS